MSFVLGGAELQGCEVEETDSAKVWREKVWGGRGGDRALRHHGKMWAGRLEDPFHFVTCALGKILEFTKNFQRKMTYILQSSS